MKVNMNHLPPDIIQQYNLHEKGTIEEYVYIKIKTLIYILKKATAFENNNLVKILLHNMMFYAKFPEASGDTQQRKKFLLC